MSPSIGDTVDANNVINDTVENMMMFEVLYQNYFRSFYKIKQSVGLLLTV